MTKHTYKMILMQLIYSIFKSFVLIFVNIYLWKMGKSIKAVAIFNLFNYIAAFSIFFIANRIALKNVKFNYFFSSLSFILLFILTAVLGDSISRYAFLIGILGGFGDGLFFFNLNIFQSGVLNRDEVDKFMSATGITSKISSIATPLISGIVIEKFGFIYMVYVLIILLLFQIINVIFLPTSKVKTIAKLNFKKLITIKSFRNVFATHAIISPYGQFIIMANSVFLYSFVESESLMGVLNSLFAISAILFYYIYIRIQKYVTRKKLMFFGALSYVIAVLLLFKPSFTTFVVFSLSVCVGDAFFNKPLVGLQLYDSKKYADNESEMLGNLGLRVLLLTTGRSMFYVLVFLFYNDISSIIFKVLIMYNICSPLISYELCKKDI